MCTISYKFSQIQQFLWTTVVPFPSSPSNAVLFSLFCIKILGTEHPGNPRKLDSPLDRWVIHEKKEEATSPLLERETQRHREGDSAPLSGSVSAEVGCKLPCECFFHHIIGEAPNMTSCRAGVCQLIECPGSLPIHGLTMTIFIIIIIALDRCGWQRHSREFFFFEMGCFLANCDSPESLSTEPKDHEAKKGPWRSSILAFCLQTELTFIE